MHSDSGFLYRARGLRPPQGRAHLGEACGLARRAGVSGPKTRAVRRVYRLASLLLCLEEIACWSGLLSRLEALARHVSVLGD